MVILKKNKKNKKKKKKKKENNNNNNNANITKYFSAALSRSDAAKNVLPVSCD